MPNICYEIEMPLVPVLVNIESNGVLLDTEALKQSSQHFTVRLQEIEKEIYEMAGETFNISSAKQVGEVLFDKLKSWRKRKRPRPDNTSPPKRCCKATAASTTSSGRYWNTAD